MQTAKLFDLEQSQAVRLPKNIHFDGTEVMVKQMGDGILLLPIKSPWVAMQEALTEFEPDLILQREPQGEQVRDHLL